MSDPAEPEPDAPAGLTTGAVARRLGVAPTTLRSWDRRYGMGPARRPDGRHRRWTEEDIALLLRMCELTGAGLPPADAARAARAEAAPPGVPAPRTPRGETPAGRLRRESRGLARAAVRLDSDALDALLTAAVDEHGLVTAWTEVMVPALLAVGRKWQHSGERYVEVEHLLSWHVSSALRRARAVPSPQSSQFPQHPQTSQRPPAPAFSGPCALLACVPGEGHTLPLEALAAALTERNHPVRMFGAALPVEALDSAVRRTGPAAVVLWAQSRTTVNRALAQHVATTAWGVRGARGNPLVLTAGPGWAGPRVPGTVRPLTLREALDALEPALAPRTG